jgi:tripartite-type tricarboxylate transporter receptor subunit TctC
MAAAQKVFALLVLAMAAGSVAAADFPGKPIRMVVPFPAGGTLDVAARLISARLRESWHQPVIVENRVGGNGAIAGEYVVKSAPDGHTMVLSALPIVATPHLQAMPYDLNRDLAAVVQTAAIRYVLSVHPKTGVSSLNELIELARRDPNRLNYAGGGTGSASHLYAELVKRSARINLTHIPYKGDGPALQGFLAGEVDLFFSTASSMMPLARSGKARALMVTGSKPLDGLPNVAPMESVYPGVGTDGWHGLFAPAATPKPLLERIAADVRAAVLSPEVAGRIREMGFEPTGLGPERFGEIVRRDYERWGQLIRENNIRAD